ncbi:60S ribosomal protein L6 [Blastocystis sp. subtype 4]|uniref:60S ribosomal protein L6 n=1 Tax=Blastocystis sp. subtype 4 TaxID=944170 RepID=UPI000711CD1E|nr:60S ribosomal protein L6 [Blastocystis sp. subtype 4]KNB44988.1 60S ribosomal protein L6 [Blastocystis sp. subtype 4]|eukprot:XP_014528431.1 60S ribosomal protein L6 [Blastocystis sp. subtype 4]
MSKTVSKFFPIEAPAAVEAKPTKLRATITPGTVLIILAGRFAGKRVVFLKQLPSGLLLVSGPYQVNKVPLRRVNQRYVVATSTKVDISSVKIPQAVNDAYFKAPAKKSEELFSKEYVVARRERKANQEAVDAELMKCIEKVPMLKEYLHERFTLQRGDRPHDMKF